MELRHRHTRAGRNTAHTASPIRSRHSGGRPEVACVLLGQVHLRPNLPATSSGEASGLPLGWEGHEGRPRAARTYLLQWRPGADEVQDELVGILLHPGRYVSVDLWGRQLRLRA